MPKRTKRVYKRKRSQRKKSNKPYTITVRGPGVVLPDRLRCCLKYSDSIQGNPAALTATYTYNLNSIYDPNRAGTGHQPMYHDQLAGLYNRYRVLGCAWDLTCTNFNTPVRVAVAPVNGSSVPADLDDTSENPYAKTAVVNAMSNGGRMLKKFKGYIGISKLLGENLTDDRDQALMGASPSNVAMLALRVESLDGATNLSSVNYSITLKYYVECFDRITVTGS